eukprot:3383863-Prymnesium_polylepis.1
MCIRDRHHSVHRQNTRPRPGYHVGNARTRGHNMDTIVRISRHGIRLECVYGLARLASVRSGRTSGQGSTPEQVASKVVTPCLDR